MPPSLFLWMIFAPDHGKLTFSGASFPLVSNADWQVVGGMSVVRSSLLSWPTKTRPETEWKPRPARGAPAAGQSAVIWRLCEYTVEDAQNGAN